MQRPSLAALVAAAAVSCAGLAQAQTLRWASQGDPQTMDPYSQNESLTNAFNGQIYEFLVARDKKLDLVPRLATEWKQDGPLKWTFKLRQGVKFHDGRPFTADDVVFSVERAPRRRPRRSAPTPARSASRRRSTTTTVEFTPREVRPDLPRAPRTPSTS